MEREREREKNLLRICSSNYRSYAMDLTLNFTWNHQNMPNHEPGCLQVTELLNRVIKMFSLSGNSLTTSMHRGIHQSTLPGIMVYIHVQCTDLVEQSQSLIKWDDYLNCKYIILKSTLSASDVWKFNQNIMNKFFLHHQMHQNAPQMRTITEDNF